MIKKAPAFSLRIAYSRTVPILIEFSAFSSERLLNRQLYGLSGAQTGHVGLGFGALSLQRFFGKCDGETCIADLASLPPSLFLLLTDVLNWNPCSLFKEKLLALSLLIKAQKMLNVIKLRPQEPPSLAGYKEFEEKQKALVQWMVGSKMWLARDELILLLRIQHCSVSFCWLGRVHRREAVCAVRDFAQIHSWASVGGDNINSKMWSISCSPMSHFLTFH